MELFLLCLLGLDRTWSHEATEFMKHWASNETLEALVVHKDSQLHIEIVNSKKQSINSLLIQKVRIIRWSWTEPSVI